MAAILAARQALTVLRLSISSSSLIQRRGLAGASGLHGPKKVDSWKDPKSPFPSKEEHEIIFICVDTSKWMMRLGRYRLQVDCVRAYCRAKLKSNPRNAIGILTMGTLEKTATLEPTSDFDEIRTHLRCIRALRGGELDFFEVFNSCADKLDHYPSNPKRFLFFTGGPIDFEMGEANWYGNEFKEQGVDVDVVNFFLDERFANCKIGLDAFVACADNNNNSLIKHVPADSRTRVRDIISSLVERKKGNNEAEELLS